MNAVKLIVIFLLLSTHTEVFGNQSDAREQTQQLKSDQHSVAQSVLWKVSGNGLQQPSYLFGSWHLLCRNEIIFKNKVKIAISQTEQLLMQNFITYLSADDYFERQKVDARINRGTPIYQLDNRKQRRRLLKLIDKNLDLKVDNAKRVMPSIKRMTSMEVFFASMHSFISDCKGLGSFDDLLFDHFRKKEAQIGAVNDVKVFQESLVSSGFVSPESLIAYIEDIESQRALVKKMKSEYYLHENLPELKKLLAIFLNNDFTDKTKINRYVFDLDVKPWVEIMSHWMTKKPTFISINASYLIGEKGVLAVLKERGYHLEPMM